MAHKCLGPQHWSLLCPQGHFTLFEEKILDIGQYCLPPASKMQLFVIMVKLTCSEGNFLRETFKMLPRVSVGATEHWKSYSTWGSAAKKEWFFFFFFWCKLRVVKVQKGKGKGKAFLFLGNALKNKVNHTWTTEVFINIHHKGIKYCCQ